MVARVGEVEIDAPQLLEFEERLHPDLRSKKTGADAYFDYLQTIIDKELMVLEAKKRGLDQRADFRRKMDKLHSDRVLRRFLQLEVYDKIVHTQEEMLAHQRETGRDRAVQVRRIVVATIEEARAIKAALEGGDDFDAWASRNLLDATQIEEGRYLIKGRAVPTHLAGEGLSAGTGPVLGAGALQRPVRRVRDNSRSAGQALGRAVGHRGRAAQGEAAAGRTGAVGPLAAGTRLCGSRPSLGARARAHWAGCQGVFCRGARAADLRARERHIYHRRSARFRPRARRRLPRGRPEQFDWFVRDIVEPRALLLAGAYTAGVDREEAVVAWFQERQLSNLLVAMRRDVVDGVFASREEAQAFYDRHPNLFRPLESIGVREILVRTEEEALALREEVERGGDLGALAAEHTLRRRGKANQGEFHLHPWEKQQFVPLFEAAQGQKIGALIGPIALEVAAAEVLSSEPISGPYYAIFRLLDSTINAAPRPFAQAERRARALVRRQKQERLFGQFIIQLRHEYASKSRCSAHR